MNKIVGISLRVVEATSYKEPRDSISHDWIRYLSAYGVTPVLIPNVLSNISEFIKSIKPSALILSNGNNICPQNESERQVGIDDISLDRDHTERELISYSIDNRLPLLGICRGMQMLNIYFGGSLLRNLSDLCGSSTVHANVSHEIQIDDMILKDELEPKDLVTNSYHNQAVTLSTLSPQLKTFVMSGHGVVEGIYHPNLPIAGIQWHPERPGSTEQVDKILFNALLRQELFWEEKS